MNDKTRNEFASYGLEILKRSVLLVLYQQHLDKSTHREDLSQETIRELLDIPKEAYSSNKLVRGILDLLKVDGYAEMNRYRTGCWQITEEGVSVIED